MYRAFWEELLSINKRISNGHVIGDCPICNEDKGHFYANIQTGQWDCKKCQASGNAITFLREHRNLDNFQIAQYLNQYGIPKGEEKSYNEGHKSRIFDRKVIEHYCSCLSEEKLQEFARERGLSIEILKRYLLGINSDGDYTLPVFDEKGNIRNILRKKLGGNTISATGGEALLFGIDDIISPECEEIFIVEGPWSALALKERGFKSVGTCGAGILKDEQVSLLKGKEVFLVPDNDEAGKSGVDKIAKKLASIAKNIFVIDLPISEKKDVRDFFKEGGTKEQFAELVKRVRSSKESQTPILLSEFLKKDIPPLEYYVEDILPKKGKGLISAPPNLGKSLFVQNMALDIASGSLKFMNKFEVKPGRVLYLDLEMGEPALKERFQKMCQSRSVTGDNIYLKHESAMNLLDNTYQELIERWVTELKIEVIIFDPVGNAWYGNENDQEQVRKLTAYLNTLIQKHAVSILLVHHWRKASKDFKTGGQMAAGSYRWEAWTDCHITLEGKSSSITISCHKNRNRPKFSPFLVKLNEETLGLEFITDYQKKYDEGTLERLFESFGMLRVSIPELIKRAKEQDECSETTLRKLIEESTIFRVDKNSKTHFLERKTNEPVLWEEEKEVTNNCSLY